MPASLRARLRGSDGLPPSFPVLLVFAAGVLLGSLLPSGIRQNAVDRAT